MVEMLAKLVENVRQFGLERVFKRYYSVYRAQVVDNKDPQKRGRVKVKVPSLFGDFVLPQMVEPIDFRNSATGKGEFFPPDVDDWVFVQFEGGDQRFPLYCGGWHGKADLDPIFTHLGDGTPQVRGYKDKFGNYWIFDQTAGKETIKMFNPSENGNTFVMDNLGIRIIDKFGNTVDMKQAGVDVLVKGVLNVTVDSHANIKVGGNADIDVTGNLTAKVGGTAKIDVGGTTDVTSGGTCKVTAPKIELNGSASGITTENSHFGVVDQIVGLPVIPSPTVFSDV